MQMSLLLAVAEGVVAGVPAHNVLCPGLAITQGTPTHQLEMYSLLNVIVLRFSIIILLTSLNPQLQLANSYSPCTI